MAHLFADPLVLYADMLDSDRRKYRRRSRSISPSWFLTHSSKHMVLYLLLRSYVDSGARVGEAVETMLSYNLLGMAGGIGPERD